MNVPQFVYVEIESYCDDHPWAYVFIGESDHYFFRYISRIKITDQKM